MSKGVQSNLDIRTLDIVITLDIRILLPLTKILCSETPFYKNNFQKTSLDIRMPSATWVQRKREREKVRKGGKKQ